MLPPMPWVVTQRSGPGFRIEASDGTLIAYGPEPPEAAGVAQELVMLMNTRSDLLDRIEMLESALRTSAHVISEHRETNESLNREILKLRELLDETYETVIDGENSECAYLTELFEKKEYVPNAEPSGSVASKRRVRKSRSGLGKRKRTQSDVTPSEALATDPG